jgi:hypothetical protein
MDSQNIEQPYTPRQGSPRQGTPRQGTPQHDPHLADLAPACVGLVALLEIAVVSVIVVGFFDAVSQPLGWTSAVQSFLCACLALLLWRVEAARQTDDTMTVAYASHQSANYEATRQES